MIIVMCYVNVIRWCKRTNCLFSKFVGFRGWWVLCLNLKCSCTINLLDPELLNLKP